MKRAALVALLGGSLLFPSLPVAQVRSPTLRDEAREKGYVWHSAFPESRTLATFDDLITRSDLIIRGRVIDERTRLSPDENQVLTDCTIEVLEIFKNSQPTASVGDKVVVTKPGGNLLLEGKPVRIDTPTFPPIPWIAPHIFFIARWKGTPTEYAQYYFTGLGLGVLAIEKDRIGCKECERVQHPILKAYEGKTPGEFIQLLKEKIVALSGSSGRPRGRGQ